ncbi:MAG: TetR/AcrR family transcriptional regulator [Bacillota bacterium]
MPRPLTSAERARVVERLVSAGRECWEKYGIRRTTVDDLAKRAGIAKGTFYLFFEGKEQLFMAVLEGGHAELKGRLLAGLSSQEGPPRERFVSAIMQLYAEIQGNGWLMRLLSEAGEYEHLLRSLPTASVTQHILGDDADTAQLLAAFRGASVDARTVSAALRALFCTLLHQVEIGPERFPAAFHLLVEGLAARIFEVDAG